MASYRHDDFAEVVWPEKLTLRDTKIFADEGQRIFTTATGHGYEKREYVRADLVAPQPSPSDEVRGLIERLRVGASTSNSVSMHMRKYQDLCDEAADALARFSTPPSSPVSGEGEREAHMDAYQYGGDAPSRPPEAVANAVRDLLQGIRFYSMQDEEACRRRVADAIASFDRPPEPAANGEPVAWRVTFKEDGRSFLTTNKKTAEKHRILGEIVEPLGSLTRPPEGNARVLRDAWQTAQKFLRDYGDGRATALDVIDRILALPADDEAKRIRAEVIKAAQHTIAIVRNYLTRFNPANMPEDDSQQWQSLKHQLDLLERALAQPEQD